jgi:hypothetical protein
MFWNRGRFPFCQLELIDCQKSVVFTDIENSIYHSVTVLLQVSLELSFSQIVYEILALRTIYVLIYFKGVGYEWTIQYTFERMQQTFDSK